MRRYVAGSNPAVCTRGRVAPGQCETDIVMAHMEMTTLAENYHGRSKPRSRFKDPWRDNLSGKDDHICGAGNGVKAMPVKRGIADAWRLITASPR